MAIGADVLPLDRDPLVARFKRHEEAACRGNHRDTKTGSGIRFGTPVCLRKVTKRTVHQKQAITDTKEDRWTL